MGFPKVVAAVLEVVAKEGVFEGIVLEIVVEDGVFEDIVLEVVVEDGVCVEDLFDVMDFDFDVLPLLGLFPRVVDKVFSSVAISLDGTISNELSIESLPFQGMQATIIKSIITSDAILAIVLMRLSFSAPTKATLFSCAIFS